MKSPSSFVGFPEAPTSYSASVQVAKKAKNGQKWQKSFKIQIFWVIWSEKPKLLSSLLSYNLWNWAMLKNDHRKPWGASKDPKMTKKGKKLTHFRQFRELKKNIEISYQNINLFKDIVSIKYKRLKTAKKFDPHSRIRPKTAIRSKIAILCSKWQRWSLKRIFLMISSNSS